MATKKIPARTKRAIQPQSAVLVDWSNTVTKGLSLAFIGGSPVDHTRNTALVPGGQIVTSVNAAGVSSIGSSTSYFNVSPPLPDSGTEFSVVAAVRYEAVGEQGYLSKATSSVSGQWNFIATTSSQVRLEVLSGGGGSVSGATTLVAGRIYTIAATYKAGAVLIYVNGVLDGTGTLPALTPSGSPISTLLKHDNSFAATGGVNFLGVWNKRALSPAEIKKVSSNVWSVFQQSPAKSSLWLAPTGTISRPNSDIVVSGWVGVPNSALHANVNEATASDAEYIDSPGLSATPTTCTFGLSLTLAAGTYDVGIRAQWVSQSGQLRVVLLDSGGTSVGASSYQALTSSATSYTLPVTTTGSATQARIEASL